MTYTLLPIVVAACLVCAAHAQQNLGIEVPLSDTYSAGERFMDIRLLGTLRLPTEASGVAIGALSGLAWDEDEQRLYAISDKGELLHFVPFFKAGLLHAIQLSGHYRLRDAQGKPLGDLWSDAEGLAIVQSDNGIHGDSELLVSFEAKPRIARYRPDGRLLGPEPLPAPLSDPRRFVKPNLSLEAITLHPRWGLMIAPERPLVGTHDNTVLLVSREGKQWNLPLSRVPNSSLVAIEALPDGSLLTLERAFVSLTRPFYILLRQAQLPESGKRAQMRDIAVLNSTQGWLLDNFEGLTRHRGNRFFMISDDNRNILQNTLLVYFEIPKFRFFVR